MALFDRFRRPVIRPVGDRLERGRDEGRRPLRARRSVKLAIFLSLLLLTLLAFPQRDVYDFTVAVGDRWERATLQAPFSFPLARDPAQIAEERRQIRYETPPYFREVPDAMARMQANRDTVAQQLLRVFDRYVAWQTSRSRGQTERAAQDSLSYLEARRRARLKATPQQWQQLVESYAGQEPGLSTASREASSDPRLDERFLHEALDTGVLLARQGVLDVPRDSILTEDIVIRDLRARTQRIQAKTSVLGLNDAYLLAQQRFAEAHPDPEQATLVGAFFRAIFQPSLAYQSAETQQAWAQKEARIARTQDLVREGEVIVRRDDLITDEVLRKLTSLRNARAIQTGQSFSGLVLLGQLLATACTYFFFFLYLFLLRRAVFDDNRRVLLIALLFALIIGFYALAMRLPGTPMYAVPVAMVSVLLTVMFDSRVSLFGTLALALMGSHFWQQDFSFTFSTLFAGALGVFSVRDIRNRGQFFISAGLVFLGYLVTLLAATLVEGTALPAALTGRFGWDLLLVGINAVLLLLAYPLLWVFERAFDITTDLTLLELSDTNRPLLKELSLRAPGTFNHVLQVANMTEAAAAAIGANPLLARVGALYHDVGKMLKPEYYVENQRPGFNPHDPLKPRMSALIIASHVKEGLEIARQYRLPKQVTDFIPMHHGTTRIEYFYRKALEQMGSGDSPLQEADFRYPGPRPDTKETGILMLADSVEAASRTLTNPTHKRLETLIDMILQLRRDDGQLDDTGLTFRDLTRIKQTFLTMLLGIYHLRLKYPGQELEEPSARDEAPEAEAPTGTTAGTDAHAQPKAVEPPDGSEAGEGAIEKGSIEKASGAG
jgi:putative nucleotidyltransferase with HDIG domain